MRYLLDTNVVSAIIKRDHRVGEKLRSLDKRDLVLSSIVLSELYFGAAKSSRTGFYIELIQSLEIAPLPFEAGDAKATGELRMLLQRQGRPIGPYDVMIAGHALARDLTLVTHNVREFSRVPGLRIEDWEA